MSGPLRRLTPSQQDAVARLAAAQAAIENKPKAKAKKK
jgi:hypothetical protein